MIKKVLKKTILRLFGIKIFKFFLKVRTPYEDIKFKNNAN